MLIFEEVCFIFSASAYSFRDLTRPLTRDSKEAPGPQVDEDGCFWFFKCSHCISGWNKDY